MYISLYNVISIQFYTVTVPLLFDIFRTVSCQCAGSALVLKANETFQFFTSQNYPADYPNDEDCEWLIEAANVTHVLRLQIRDAAIEYHSDCVYDYGEVFDGNDSGSASLGKFCGTDTPTYASTGYQMTVTFRSDYSIGFKGFRARYKSGAEETITEEEEEEETTQHVDIVTVIAGAVGGVALLVVILTVIFVYIQSRKAKRNREQLARQGLVARTSSGSRVHPYDHNNRRFLLGPPPPPAYGDIYSTPVSPPPAYSEIDPNPQPSTNLPGTPDMPMPESTSSNNSCNHNSSTITVMTDSNSNTHFSVMRLTRNLPAYNDTNRPNVHTTPRRNPQSNTTNTGARRTVSNQGALAALQILNPSAYTTNILSNNSRTTNTNSSDNESRGERPNTLSLPSRNTDITPRDVNAELSARGTEQNVVEVEVHRERSAVSSVSDISEVTLPSGHQSPDSRVSSQTAR